MTVHVATGGEDRGAPALDAADVKVEWFSGTGSGGQHRNKHQNSARVVHVPTGIVRTAQTRSRETSLREAMAALERDVAEAAGRERRESVNAARRDVIGSGERSDRRRTWAFQRDVVEDFVTGASVRCREALDGALDKLW